MAVFVCDKLPKISVINANTDNPVKHSNSIENNEEKNGSMDQVIAPTITFQSKANTKAKVTLEFGDEVMGSNSKEELESILKHLFIEKTLKSPFLSKPHEVQANPIES